MLSFRPLLLLLLILGMGISQAGTIVQLATPVGNMKFELYDSAKPVTTANFLNYITSGRYEDTFAHRLPPGFVLQGGGFGRNEGGYFIVPTFAPIVNEAGPFPEYSNVFGTISMAKLGEDQPGGGPNSATSGWFINLGNNSFLDTDNGGFTVFGRIVEGGEVLTSILNTFVFAPDGPGVYNASAFFGSTIFERMPLLDNFVAPETLFYTDWSIVPEPSAFLLLTASFAGAAIVSLRSRYRRIAAMSHTQSPFPGSSFHRA